MLLTLLSTLKAGGGVAATLNVTEAGDTLASVTSVPVSVGALITEVGDNLTSAGVVLTQGATATLSVVEAADSIASSAAVIVSATAVLTESADTVSGAGVLTVTATATMSESADTLTAVAALSTQVLAELLVSESSDVLTAISAAAVSATLNGSEGSDTLTAAAALAIAGTLAVVEVGDTVVAAAGIGITASASLSDDGDTLNASVSAVTSNLTAQSLIRLADIWTRLGLNVNAPTVQTATTLTAGDMALKFSGSSDIICTRTDSSFSTPIDPNTMIEEVFQRLGLDTDNPMITGLDAIRFGDITLGVSGTDSMVVQRA